MLLLLSSDSKSTFLVQHGVPVVYVASLLAHLPLPLVLLVAHAIKDIGSGAELLVVYGGHGRRRLVLVRKGENLELVGII